MLFEPGRHTVFWRLSNVTIKCWLRWSRLRVGTREERPVGALSVRQVQTHNAACTEHALAQPINQSGRTTTVQA